MKTPDVGTKHTCNPAKPGHPLPFGRRDPGGQAPAVRRAQRRCDAARGPGLDVAVPRERRYPTTDELDRHFASERHRSGGCGVVCTFGDW